MNKCTQLMLLATVAVITVRAEAAAAQVAPVQPAPAPATPGLRTATPESATSASSAVASPSATDTSESVAGDIVVTAQRRTQRLLDVPISASVVSGQTLDRLAIVQLTDLSNRLPNVKIAAGANGYFIAVRGIASGLNAGFEQSVGTFVDGLYRGRSLSVSSSLFDIESIEILKGPQTTYFGNNTVAGAINITTKKPTSQPSGDVSVLYGSQSEYDVRAAVGGPITPTLRMRVAVGANGSRGYIFNEALNEFGPRTRDLMGRVSAIWAPSSDLQVSARLDRGHIRDTGVYNAELVNCPPAAIYGSARGVCARSLALGGGVIDDKVNFRTYTGPSFFNYDYTEGLIDGRITVGNNTLSVLGGYFDHTNTVLDTVTPGRGASAIGFGYGLTAAGGEKYHQYSGEIRLESTGSPRLGYMIGAYIADTGLNVRTNVGYYFVPLGPLAGLPATTPVAGQIYNRQTQTTKSVFAALNFAVTGKVRLNLGARYSSVRKFGTRNAAIGTSGIFPDPSNFVPLPAPAQAILSGATGIQLVDYPQNRITNSRFMPSIGVQYTFDSNSMAYATVATGFKAGGFGTTLSTDVFGSERVTSYELGYKAALFNRNLTLTLAGFYANYANLQEGNNLVVGNSVISVIRNAAKAVSKGVEASAVARLSSSLTVSFDVAYLSSQYKDFRNAGCTVLQNLRPPCTQDLSGRTRAYSPKFSGNMGISYTKALNNALVVRFNPSAYFSTEYFEQTTLDPLAVQGGYIKVDATLSIGRLDRRWEIALLGKNLTDIVTADFRNSAVPSSPGSALVVPNRPRSIAIQLTSHF